MKRVLLTSLWLTIVSYLLISGIFGNSGLIAMQKASEISLAMEENIRVLQEKNADYTMNLQSLVDSPERIAQEGRSLGYLGINEVALTIKNRKSPPVSTANAGFLLSYTAPVLCQDKTARLYALSLGVLVFLVYGFLLFIKNRKIR